MTNLIKHVSFKFSPSVRGYPFFLTPCCTFSYTGKKKMLQPNRWEPSKSRLLVYYRVFGTKGWETFRNDAATGRQGINFRAKKSGWDCANNKTVVYSSQSSFVFWQNHWNTRCKWPLKGSNPSSTWRQDCCQHQQWRGQSDLHFISKCEDSTIPLCGRDLLFQDCINLLLKKVPRAQSDPPKMQTLIIGILNLRILQVPFLT